MTRRRRSDLVHVSAYVDIVMQHQAAGVPVPTSGDDRPGVNDTTARMTDGVDRLKPWIEWELAEARGVVR